MKPSMSSSGPTVRLSSDTFRMKQAVFIHLLLTECKKYVTMPPPPDQWCYVDTKENPADNASRGLGANELIRSNRWWNGPNFLWKPLPDEPNSDTQISPEDPEVQKVKALATNSIEHPSLLDRIEYFSDWYHAKRAIAVCLSFIQKMKLRINKDQGNSSWDESNPPQQDNGQKQQD